MHAYVTYLSFEFGRCLPQDGEILDKVRLANNTHKFYTSLSVKIYCHVDADVLEVLMSSVDSGVLAYAKALDRSNDKIEISELFHGFI